MTAALPQILEGIRRHESLPGMSITVNRVVSVSSAENRAVSDIAEVILSDPSLTQRVLRVANSAVYAWDGGVDTVSRAIMLLGFDTVRTIALSLILLDRLADPRKQRLLQTEIAGVLAAATLAQTIGEAAAAGSERCAIKALLRRMGTLMTAMYATPEHMEIKQRAASEGISESAAAYDVLGVRYEVIAEAAIAEWALPEEYRRVPTRSTNLEGSTLVAALSCELTELLARVDVDHPDVGRFVASHAEKLRMAPTALAAAIAQGRERFVGLTRNLGLPDITRRKAEALLEKAAVTAHVVPRPHVRRASAERDASGRPANYREVLFHGIGDIASAVAADEGLTVLVRMVVDTLEDAMGYQRALFLFRDASRGLYRVRYAVGRDAETLQRDFTIPLRSTVSSVFHAAIERDACIHIEDTRAEKVAPHLPPWFAALGNAGSFVLLPVTAGRTILGAFYADRSGADRTSTPEDLEMLVTLKNQVVLALKANQRRAGPTT